MLKINLAKLCFTRSLSGFTTKHFCYISLIRGGGGGGGGGVKTNPKKTHLHWD